MKKYFFVFMAVSISNYEILIGCSDCKNKIINHI